MALVAAGWPLDPLLRTLEPTGTVNAVAFSPDGRTLASGSVGGGTTLWDVASGKAVAPRVKHFETPGMRIY